MDERQLSKNDYASCAPKRVRYHEVDIQKIVFNAHYLAFADIAVTEYFRALNLADGGDGSRALEIFGAGGDCMVRHAEVDFLASARADDMLDLCARVSRMGNSSFMFEIGIFREEELLALVRNSYVHFLHSTGRPAPLPESFRARVRAFENIPPQEQAHRA